MNDFVLEGRLRQHAEDVETSRASHQYYNSVMGQKYLDILAVWQKRNNFKAMCSLSPERTEYAATTLWQRIYHGRKWCLDHLGDGHEWMQHIRRVQLKKTRGGVITFTYRSEEFITKELVNALEFGELQFDVQQACLDWMDTDPPHGAVFPETDGVIITDSDHDFFTRMNKVLLAATPPRYVMILEKDKVTIRSIKQEDAV